MKQKEIPQQNPPTKKKCGMDLFHSQYGCQKILDDCGNEIANLLF